MASVNVRLLRVLSVDEATRWLKTPHADLRGISPEAAIRNGEFMAVNDAVERLLGERHRAKRRMH